MLIATTLLATGASIADGEESPPPPLLATAAPAESAAEQTPPAPKTLKVPSEYRRKVVKGIEMYCTQTTIVGSRFPKTLCVDEAGLRTLLELRASNQQSLTRAQSLCASGKACQIE
jgi:hypothetical protein